MKTLEQFNFQDKRALVRVDFNVPLNDQQEITDDTRIQAALPTLRKVLNDGGSLVIMSHLGRPKSGPEDKFSLKHIVGHLSKCLNTEVKFASDCISDEGFSQSKDLKPGEVLLLENLRFYPLKQRLSYSFLVGAGAQQCPTAGSQQQPIRQGLGLGRERGPLCRAGQALPPRARVHRLFCGRPSGQFGALSGAGA